MLTVDLVLHDRLQQEEEERKRRLRTATDIGEGAMSNLLTLLGQRDVAQQMQQVKAEAGLVTLKRDYDRLQADGYTMSPNTYADTLTEYVDPGHLRKSLDTAINTGLIKDDEFGQKTVNRWGSIETLTAHRRNDPQPLDDAAYWHQMSMADQGQDPLTTAKILIGMQPGGARNFQEETIMGSNTWEEYQRNLQRTTLGQELMTPLTSRIPGVRQAVEAIGEVPIIGKPVQRTIEIATTPAVLATAPFAPVATAQSVIGAGVAGGIAEEAGASPEVQMGAMLAGGVAGPIVGRGVPALRAPRPTTAVGAEEMAQALGREGAVPEVAAPVAETAAIPEAPAGLPRLDPPEPITAQPSLVTEFELPPMGGGASTSYAGELRPFAEVVDEVVTSDNPVVKALVARTGINPSIAQGTPLGRTLVAYERQMVAADQVTEVALQAGLDSHAQRYTGRQPFLDIAKNENLRGVTPKPGAKSTSLHWEDVFSRPDDYVMRPELRAYIDDYLRIVDDAEAQRVLNGLKPRATRTKEGWFYVPRQVAEAHGIVPRRPSNPALMRVYEEAQAGVANGIRYGADPRETLRVHLRQSYREVIEAQLSEAVEPLSVTTKQIMPKPVLQRMSDATVRRIAAERVVRKAGRAATPEMRAELTAAKAQWTTVKSAYTAARKAADKAQWAKGALFGRQEEYIPIVKWRNRFLPLEDYQKLSDALRQIAGVGPKPNIIARQHQILGNAIRFLASVGDFAEPFVQGLLVFGKDPPVWVRAALRHYQAWFDPTVQARMIKDHLATFQEMARYGTPVGDPEFFAALRTGEGIPAGQLLAKVPGGASARQFLRQGGRQTFGRFQAQYNTGLGYSRALLTEGMKPTWKGTMADLQATIRNLTGGLDTRALGVGPTQRGLESMWLAFAPRLLRSTAALVADLRYGPFNPRGRVAYESLGKLMMGATGIYIATGLALGKSWEEIEAGLNPLAGKKFMSHEINGDWIGIGGQVRAVTQLVATTAVDIYGIKKGKRPELTQMSMDNPLFQFYSSRGAVGMTTAGAAVEAATGLNVMPFENIDSFPDLVKHIGTSALPFTIQGQLEGESLWTWPFSFGGLRVSAGTTWEATQKARDVEAKARGFKGWDDPGLDAPTKYQIDQGPTVAPLLQQLEKEGENRPQTPQSQYYAQVDTLRAAQQIEQNKDDDFYRDGKITVRQWQDRTSGRNNDIWVAMQQAQKDFGITFKEGETTNPVDAAIAAYYAVDAEQYKDETGEIAWDQFNAARDASLAPLSTVERGQVEDYIHKFWTDKQWEMYRKQQQLTEYFDIPEQVYQANRERLGLAAPSYTAYKTQSTKEAQDRAVAAGLDPGAASQFLSRADKTLQKRIEDERVRYRKRNPDKADLILELGYKPWSEADIRRQRGGGGGLPELPPLEGLGGLEELPPLLPLPPLGR